MLPVDPIYSRLILLSKDFRCTSEILDIVSLLSVENVFFSPREDREKATVCHKRFASIYGDHLTLLNVFKAYKYSAIINLLFSLEKSTAIFNGAMTIISTLGL